MVLLFFTLRPMAKWEKKKEGKTLRSKIRFFSPYPRPSPSLLSIERARYEQDPWSKNLHALLSYAIENVFLAVRPRTFVRPKK